MAANITGTIIAMGYNCQVRVGSSALDAKNNVLALVTSFQATEDFQVQEAVCLNTLGPIAIDPQGYTCTITLDGFVPSKKVLDGTALTDDGAKISIMDKMPTREDFMGAGGGGGDAGNSAPKFAYLDFFNKRANSGAGQILASFEGVLITSNGISSEANSYVKNNVQMRALAKTG
jgi:hypothetical protein